VEGVDDLPAPRIDPPVPIVLGRRSPSRSTTQRLMASIVNPNLHITAAHRTEEVSIGGKSRMYDFTRALTVRELIDIVAFIQAAEDDSYHR
jgi:hypothetical protein